MRTVVRCLLVLALVAWAPLAAAQTLDPATLMSFLPVVDGFSMSEPDTMDQEVGGTRVSQAVARYQAGGERVTVSLIASPSMVMAARGMGAAFRSAQMMKMMNDNAAAKGKDVTYGFLGREGWQGWTVVNGDEASGEATGMTDEMVVKVEVEGGSGATLEAFVAAIDWAGLLAAH